MAKKTEALILLAFCIGLAGCASEPAATGAPPAVAQASAEQTDSRMAPDFSLPIVGGGERGLADGAGKVRLVDFWATWCAPCRDEIPMLNELQATYGDQGFEILAITTEDAELIGEFMAEHGVTYTNLIGSDELLSEYEVPGLPTGFLIDGEGRIQEVFYGPKPRRILEKQIQQMLGAV